MSLNPDVAPVATGYGHFTLMPLESRIRVLKDLMRGMDLATLVGRGLAMNKMLVLLRREALRLEPPVAAEDLASLSNAMTDLEHEVGRIAPSPSIFNQHVEVAIGALRRTAFIVASLVVERERKTP
jgi:hypothetical protein